MGEEDIFIYSHGTWKDNISSVILDWRQRSAGRSSRPVLSSCVFSGRHTTSQKVSPPQKKHMCELSLYSYYTQSSLSKNKNINYILIYLLLLHCLSAVRICVKSILKQKNVPSLICKYISQQHRHENSYI